MAYVDLNTLHNPATSAAPPATWGDQARDNDQYLYERGPYICTSATRPGAPFEGQLIYETDTDYMYVYTGAAWIHLGALGTAATWTPTLTQSAAVTKTVTTASYARIGRQVYGRFNLTATAAGTAANNVTVSTPVNMNTADFFNYVVGTGYIYDASSAIKYRALLVAASASAVKFLTLHSTTDGHLGATDFTAALANGDIITGQFQYEAASAS